jgi:HK97 family phage prohead protease
MAVTDKPYPVMPGTGAQHYRSFAPDLQVQSSGDGRTIYGIAVPYNAPTRIDGNLIEQFARSAFNHQLNRPQRVKFAREHMALGGELIGAASVLRDDPAGLYVELRVSRTKTGDDTLELVRDGALNELSIAFREGRNRKLPGGITERVEADLREVAVVRSAQAVGVLERQEIVDAELRADYERVHMRGLPELDDIATKLEAIRLGLI